MTLDFANQLKARTERYLIGRPQTRLNSLETMNLDFLADEIFPTLDISLIEKIKSSTSGSTEVLLVDMDSIRYERLNQAYGHRLTIEEDTALEIYQPNVFKIPLEQEIDSNLVTQESDGLTIQFAVKGGAVSQPVANARVYVIGGVWFANGVTDAQGKVTLTLYGETPETLKGLYIKPAHSYWSFWLARPAVTPGQENIVSLNLLSEQVTQFPQKEVYGWGQKAMQLDAGNLPYRGKGIKVAIIDSGLYTDHTDLGEGKNGQDYTKDAPGWKKDIVGHGSHVAGVVAGLHEATGIKGFAPEADLYIYKVFPGGRFSDLIKSLNQCIEQQVDVVNLSLGSKKRSQLLEQKIREATDRGVACIAAAGNSATKIQYPAAFKDVFAVAAIGQTGTFPQNSYHQRQVGQHTSNDGQYFTAQFTCFAEGDQVMDVCAPGVAIISSVPNQPTAYAAWDGTSMACPHVVGLAALMLEARAELRDMSRGRDRVEALFKAIRGSAEDLGLPKAYQGAGLPSLRKALPMRSGGCPDVDKTSFEEVSKLLSRALEILQKQLKG